MREGSNLISYLRRMRKRREKIEKEIRRRSEESKEKYFESKIKKKSK